jgi:hypothetical protein
MARNAAAGAGPLQVVDYCATLASGGAECRHFRHCALL